MPRPSVFVSSAARGFEDLRQSLSYVLEQRGFEVLAFEEATFPVSGDRRALEECLSVVRSADYYLLLIGDTAGRVEAGTSPTREEYQAARDAFLNSGRPRLVLTIRGGTRDAIDRWRREGIADRLENPEFVASLVAEVEAASGPEVPNWLHRFGDFRELMEILVTRLRIGRDHEETLARRAILDEVLNNLAAMCSRSGESAIPDYLWAAPARKEIQLSSADLGATLKLPREVARSLGTCFMAGDLGPLRTAAMEQATLAGTFLEYSTEEQRLVPSVLHEAVAAVVQDIKRAKAVLETSINWRMNLMVAAGEANRTKAPYAAVGGADVMWALAYVDRAEDAFRSQTALAQYLIGKRETPLPDPDTRNPLTPVRDSVEGIWRESLEKHDIEHLIAADIRPFGSRVPASTFEGKDVEELVAKMVRRVLPQFEAALKERYPDAAHFLWNPGEVVKEAASDFIRQMTAAPGEGIENRDRPDKRAEPR